MAWRRRRRSECVCVVACLSWTNEFGDVNACVRIRLVVTAAGRLFRVSWTRSFRRVVRATRRSAREQEQPASSRSHTAAARGRRRLRPTSEACVSSPPSKIGVRFSSRRASRRSRSLSHPHLGRGHRVDRAREPRRDGGDEAVEELVRPERCSLHRRG
jgi:hypothetical protein